MTDRTGGRANIPMTNPFQTVSHKLLLSKQGFVKKKVSFCPAGGDGPPPDRRT